MDTIGNGPRRTNYSQQVNEIQEAVSIRLYRQHEPLAALSERIAGMATQLVSLARTPPNETQVSARYVRSIIAARRARSQFFGDELFADPAWDMLLDLTAAALERNSVAISSLCLAAAVPTSTALRWIRTMQDQGILVRASDPDDGRRSFVALSPNSFHGMLTLLEKTRTSLAA